MCHIESPYDIFRIGQQKSIRASPSVYVYYSQRRSDRVNLLWPLKVQGLNCEPSGGQSKTVMYIFDEWVKSHWRTKSHGPSPRRSWMASIDCSDGLLSSCCLCNSGRRPVNSLKLHQILLFQACFTCGCPVHNSKSLLQLFTSVNWNTETYRVYLTRLGYQGVLFTLALWNVEN